MDAVEKTSQGFLKAPAHLTRAGVLTYYNADGSERREWRPLDEVMRADSLATLVSAPVTMLHPPEMVTAANRQKYDRGNVGDNIVRDGGKVAATLYVKDGTLVAAVERGDMREVSCGYRCDLDETPGVVPDGQPDAGQRYDAIQRGINYNHVAVVPVGRAGSEVRLRLDAAGNAMPPSSGANPPREKSMKVERIDGVEYEIGTEAHTAAVARRDEAAKKVKADHDALQARLDAAEAEAKKLRADIAEMPKRVAEQAKARAALEQGARKVLGEGTKLDGVSDAEIRRQVAAKANPTLKLDGKSDDYIAALFDRAVEKTDEADAASLRTDTETREVKNDGADHADAAEQARAKMVERHRNAWKQTAKA